MLRKDITGQTFGRLTVQNFHKRDKGGKAQWLVKCECGTFRVVAGCNLTRNGHTRSCGCLSRELSSERGKLRIKHGHARRKPSPTYRSYISMLTRCHNPRATSYQHYGAKGILVCKRWRKSFENFLKDMGERPLGKTIHRIKGKLGYSKRNCRWASASEQQQSTSGTKLSPLKVRTIRQAAPYFTYQELATEYGVSTGLIGRVVTGKSWASV
jgi:hypothetical protein